MVDDEKVAVHVEELLGGLFVGVEGERGMGQYGV
jgi:hypothetical protein